MVIVWAITSKKGKLINFSERYFHSCHLPPLTEHHGCVSLDDVDANVASTDDSFSSPQEWKVASPFPSSNYVGFFCSSTDS